VTWDGSNSYSYGVDAFLSRLSANGQPEGHRAYPTNVDRATLRFQRGDAIKQWFARCVAAFMTVQQGLEYWRLEENLAAFAYVSWNQGYILEYATINVLKTECSLEDYLHITDEDLKKKEWEELSKPFYLRLDLDYGTLGPIGTHPLPHIHFSPDDPPRFTLDASRSMNVVVDFIDFVYRHYFPDTWRSWAEQTWNKHYQDQGRDPENNPFNSIISSYNESRMGVIRSRADHIAELVSVLHQAKGQLFDLRVSDTDRRLMSFPDTP
jgi:hypothetical protein